MCVCSQARAQLRLCCYVMNCKAETMQGARLQLLRKPYEFTWFVTIVITEPYKFIGIGCLTCVEGNCLWMLCECYVFCESFVNACESCVNALRVFLRLLREFFVNALWMPCECFVNALWMICHGRAAREWILHEIWNLCVGVSAWFFILFFGVTLILKSLLACDGATTKLFVF